MSNLAPKDLLRGFLNPEEKTKLEGFVMYTLTRETFNTRNMVKISVLGVISMVLMFFDLSVWFAPPFLKLDISDLPSLIGAFAMGPMAGVITQLLKNILHLLVQGSSTGGVGEISNFLVGSVLAYTAGAIYYKQKTLKRAIVGLAIGVILMSIFASLSNYFVIFPLYSKILPLDQIIAMASKLNKYVVDYKTLILFAIIPFNLLKGTVVSVITLLIYKRVSPVLHR